MTIKEIVNQRFGKITKENANLVFSEYAVNGRIKITCIETVPIICDPNTFILDTDQNGCRVDQSSRVSVFELSRLDFVTLCCL